MSKNTDSNLPSDRLYEHARWCEDKAAADPESAALWTRSAQTAESDAMHCEDGAPR
jgi:hypothetical protein